MRRCLVLSMLVLLAVASNLVAEEPRATPSTAPAGPVTDGKGKPIVLAAANTAATVDPETGHVTSVLLNGVEEMAAPHPAGSDTPFGYVEVIDLRDRRTYNPLTAEAEQLTRIDFLPVEKSAAEPIPCRFNREGRIIKVDLPPLGGPACWDCAGKPQPRHV